MKHLFTNTILSIGFIFMMNQIIAQNSHWILAPNYTSITQGIVLPLPTSSGGYQGQPAQFSQNIQVDKDGNILFFIVDNYVYDRKGHIVTCHYSGGLSSQVPLESWQRSDSVYYFSSLVSMVGTASEVLIIPDKNDCNQFHLISTGHDNTSLNTYVSYGKLKVSYTESGDLTPSSGIIAQTYTDDDGSERTASMEAMEHIIGINNMGQLELTHQRSPALSVVDNGTDYKVLYRNMGYLYQLTIDNSGIHYTTKITLPVNVQMHDRYEMETIKLTNGNTRVATFYKDYPTIGYSGVFVFNLNSSGTIITSSEKFLEYEDQLFSMQSTRYYNGIEFNSDGTRVFVTHLSYNDGSTLDYWDISGTPVKSVLSSDVMIGQGQIELAKDGKLYIPRSNSLASISNPNTTPTINLNAVSISSYPVSYGNNQDPLRLLQDQIDGSTVYDYVGPSTYHVVNYDVVTGGIWDGANNPIAPGQTVINVEKELRIKAGVSLTIKNLIINFAPNARLVVENGPIGSQGAKLNIYSTTLTNYPACGKEDMWLGVEVWGNSTAAQGSVLNSSQGVFRMYANSKIEHAYVGVLVSRRNELNGVPIETSYNNSFNGGVFISNNSTFENCCAGTLFQSYNQTATNLSSISSTSYIWDGLLKDTTKTPSAHIGMIQCNKIYISASKFYQNTPNLYADKAKWGMGILAINTDFSVTNSCSTAMPIGQDCSEANTLRSEFKNLTVGVSVLNANSKPFTVLRNSFENCFYGVSSTSAKNQKISRNTFSIHTDATKQTWGIHVKNGTGYEIAENQLLTTSGQSALSYGIIIDNSGEYENEVYKNIFSDLYIGTQAQNINGKQYIPGNNNNAKGLRYNCNTFKSPIVNADIAVAVNSRVDSEQGRVGGLTIEEARNKNTARNTFSYTSGGNDIFLSSGSQQMNYYHLATPGHAPITYTNTPPIAVYPAVQTWGGNPLYVNQNTCRTKYPSTWPPIVFPFPLGVSQQIDSLLNFIDGGDTPNLLALIVYKPKEGFTYGSLMSASPYLSDEVLINYINSSASNTNLKEVLIENSKLSDTVWSALKASSRPRMLKEDLALYQTGTSAMVDLLNNVKMKEEKLHELQQDYLYAINSDSSIISKNDSLINYLESYRGIEYKKQLLNLYSAEKNQPKFDSLLMQLELSEHLTNYYNLIFQLDQNGDWMEALNKDSSLTNQFEDLALQQDDIEASNNAKSVLDIASANFMNYQLLPLTQSSSSMIFNNDVDESSNAMNSNEYYTIYPNPSEGVVYIKMDDMESADILLFDLSGKEVYHQQFTTNQSIKLDLTTIKKGTYILKVQINDTLTKTHLLVLE